MSQSKFALPRNGFTFKRFFVAHDRCAMKVGTDGILLGAWAPIAGVKHVLDIGAGSGLLALMLAQRTGDDVHVEAVELDEEAAAQARENALASPWASRIEVWQADIHQWQPSQTRRYELIISNPPFFAEGVPCATSQREQARYTTTLDHASLLTCAAEHINEEGFFAWCCRWILVMRSSNGQGRWAGICDCVLTWRRPSCDRRIGCCWLSPRRQGSVSATGWRSAGQSSNIRKALPL
ncbi:tRNA (adenine37-N(6))-methyltransferase TrmN6 [Klebsiella pneumoniae ISC21]|nr:tRNA (adenine37-N(6))-methyltransferase TrmN6 [Klebsiella pneumoniae ISC21]